MDGQADDFTKLATLDLREMTEGDAIELWLNGAGQVVVRAYNECGNAYTELDIFKILGALRRWQRDKIELAFPTLRYSHSD